MEKYIDNKKLLINIHGFLLLQIFPSQHIISIIRDAQKV